MNWEVKVSSQAEKYYLRLPQKLQGRIKQDLKKLAEGEEPLLHPRVRPLVGKLKGFYRLRIGNYRVVFSLLRDEKIIAVVNIYPRSGAYRR